MDKDTYILWVRMVLFQNLNYIASQTGRFGEYVKVGTPALLYELGLVNTNVFTVFYNNKSKRIKLFYIHLTNTRYYW